MIRQVFLKVRQVITCSCSCQTIDQIVCEKINSADLYNYIDLLQGRLRDSILRKACQLYFCEYHATLNIRL